MRPDCLPNVFIMGAAKCDTTSLHRYLDQHPDISMSRAKEPSVFSEGRWAARRDTYDGLFAASRPIEAIRPPATSRYPVEGDAAARIHATVPDAKLLYLVREPIERTFSDYAHHVALGLEQRSLTRR